MVTLCTRLIFAVTLLGLAACGRPALLPIEDDVVPAATVDASDVLAAWQPDGDFLVSPVLLAPLGATRVAAIVRSAANGIVHLDAADDATRAFVPMTETWRDAVDGERSVVRADLPTRAEAIVIRVAAKDVALLRSITFEAVIPLPARPVDLVQAPVVVESALLDGYQPRSAWGARAASGCDGNVPKSKVTVHHTVSRLHEGGTRDQFAAEIRAAQSLHIDGRGYCDIGYHFLVSADGTVWEGRNASQLGAHTGGQNTNNLGVSFVGCFHPTSDCDGLGSTTPPQAMLNGAGAFIGTAARHYGISLAVGTTLLGHRDNAGQSTACPGDNLHRKLPDLRTIAVGGAGSTTTPPVTPPATTGKVQGVVWNLAVTEDATQATATNAKLPGARVVVSQNGVEVDTGAARPDDAYWSFDLPAGSYRVTATLEGFAAATKDITIAVGAAGWASIGLRPDTEAVAVGVTVTDRATGAPLTAASVQFGSDAPLTVDDAGRASANLPAGDVIIVARAEGYAPRTESHTVVVGQPLALTFGLEVVTGEEPTDPTDPGTPTDPTIPPAGGGLERITIKNAPSAGGGCGCTSSGGDPVAVVGLLLLALRRRRRGNGH